MIESIVLAVVQGITEFLPISSSAHLLTLPILFGWGESGLAFDVALHIGTFAATFIYFFAIWWDLLVNGLVRRQDKELKLIGYLVLATIPATVLGYFGESIVQNALRDPSIAAVMMILFGLLLWLADKYAKNASKITQLPWISALGIGFAQAVALIPGVSRSGVTISAGLAAGLTREEATRFSFLMMAPITFGAALIELPVMLDSPNKPEIGVGILVSFIIGMLAIHYMLKFLNKYGFKPYVWYRVIVGLLFLFLLSR